VLLTSVPPEILPTYPVILLAGDNEFDQAFLGELEKSLRRGSRVLMSPRHRDALGADFQRLVRQGEVEVLPPWTNSITGRPAAIPNDRLEQLAQEYLPVAVTGDPIQYEVNRTPQGWVVELINNRGVIKRRDQPAEIDPTAVARVRLESKVPCKSATEWRSNRRHPNPGVLSLEVGPGAVDFVEFQCP
jgi:hypothetical protein